MAIKKILAEKADKHLIDDWRNAFRWLSVQLAIIAGVVTTLATQYPEQFEKLLDLVPAHIRPAVAIFVSTVIPIYVRLKKQGAGASENDNG